MPPRQSRLRTAERGARFGFTLLELMIVLAILTVLGAVAWPRLSGNLALIAPREAAFQFGNHLAEAREEAIRSGEAWAVRVQRHRGNYELGPVSAFQREARRAHTASSTDAMGLLLGGQLAGAPGETALPPRASAPAVPSASELWREELPPDMVFEDGHAGPALERNEVQGQATPRPMQRRDAHLPQAPAPTWSDAAAPLGPTSASWPSPPPGQHDPAPLHGEGEWKYVVIFQADGRATDSEIRIKDRLRHHRIRLKVRGLTGALWFDQVERHRPHEASEAEHLPQRAEQAGALPTDLPPRLPSSPSTSPSLPPAANVPREATA